MRVPVICLAVLVTVILALPEARGAPTKAECESYKRQDEKSKKVAKEGEESEKYFESTSNAGGLISGKKVHSQDKQNSELEEEQSSSSEEIKTATGTKKTHTAKRQKKVVTSSVHKEVLVYFMVSYKNLPKQKSGEDRKDYYKRVFPIEDNLKQFYHKIFKNYEKETSKEYIERVEFIMNNVYTDYDPRLDVKWLDEFDHYYTLKYSRKENERDDSYYPRILAKESGESSEHYKKRMECLVAALDEEDFSHITFDDSELGYKIGVKTAKPKSKSDSTEGGQVSSQVSTSSKKSKEQEESLDASETSIERTDQSGSIAANKKEIKKKRTTVESEVNSKTTTFRMAYNKLPVKTEGQSLVDYYKNYFGEFSLDTLTPEAKSELLLRLLIQYGGETATEYCNRVDYLFTKVYPDLDIRTDANFANLLSHYYRTKYARTSSETEEEWCTRVLKKQEGESADHYKQRVTCLKTAVKEVDWSKITIDENSSDGYTLVSRGSSSTKKSVSTTPTKDTYFKVGSEDTTTYINRLTKEFSTIQNSKDYFDIVKSVYEKYPTLSLWYDNEHRELFKSFFTKMYEKTSTETTEDYHKRILTKKSSETDESYVKRIEVLQKLYPTLTIWTDNTYYEKYIKQYYLTVYKRSINEKDDTYYSRLISKSDEESDFAFITRLNLIKKTYPDIPLWYDEKYSHLVKKYYESLYEKKTNEKEETYFTRLFTKESSETDEHYFKRIQILQKLYPNLSVWYDDKYYAKWTKAYFEHYYKKLTSEDENTYFKRLIYKFDKESEENYFKRLTFIRRTSPELDLWYDIKYFDLVNKFYTYNYNKKPSETEDEHFKRIIAKESCESDNSYRKRIEFLQKLYSKLSLWYSEKYYNLVKQYYTIKYTQLKGESDEVYIKRLTKKEEGDSTDSTYGKRIHLVHLATISRAVWYDEKYYESCLKKYYEAYYKKGDDQKCADWLKKVITPLEGESESNAIKRIALIKNCTNYSCWTLEILSEIESSLAKSYITKIKETFFATASSYESSSSSKKSTSSEESDEEEFVEVSRG